MSLLKTPFSLSQLKLDGRRRVRTGERGIYVNESPDRRSLYYSKWGEGGVWRMPLEGGQETRILKDPDHWNWTLAPGGIYFLDYSFKPVENPVPYFGGLTLSPDGKSLLFG